MRAVRLPTWAEDVAWVLSGLIAIGVTWALVQIWGRSVLVPLEVAALVAFGVFCLGDFARTDPVGFASIAGPLIALGLITFLAIPDRVTDVVVLAGLWVALWLFASPRLWPWWSRNVLRRYRSGSAE